GTRRDTTRRLDDRATRPRGRQRTLRRRRQPCRARDSAGRRRGDRVLGELLRRRSPGSLARHRIHRQRADPNGRGRSGANRRRSPKLAVPARPAHRRLFRDHPPLPRRRPVAGQKLAVPGCYRMPAEWERPAATWIGWPHNKTDWPGKFAAIPWVYGEIVRRIAPGETVRAFVESQAHEAAARRVLTRVGVDFNRVEFLRLPTNRGWTRD